MQILGCPHTLQAVADEKLSKDKLQSAEAVFSLGMTIVRQLLTLGNASVFINLQGEVEIVPYDELLLDGLEEDAALDEMVNRGYDDARMTAYLMGRKAREDY